ncbi:LysR family transcriptional regulator [Streptodolium elevatio]|uniref:LysR family transcriptional regulator n=1 Tax=Streptodolium elevatio TaxID=3157996 RepID=A0ABV3DQN9_9ACTN
MADMDPVADIDLRHLRSFLAVARERTITGAAGRLHLTQQAVSTHMRHLERSLGVTLLVRTSRGVLLTAAGEELAAGGAAVMGDLTHLVERVRGVAGAQSGSVRLACCPYASSLFAVEVANALEASVPGLQVDLTSVLSPKQELELLHEGRADAAFMWLPLGDVGLHHAVIRTDPRAAVLPAHHPLAGRTELTLAELADEPVLRPDVLTCTTAEGFWLAEPRPGGTPAPRGPVVPGVGDCLLGVARGRGIWLAPMPLGGLRPTGDLRWVPVSDAPPFDLAVVWTDRAPQPLITRLIAEVRVVTGHDRRLHAA